jgi:hypothetical protein
MRQPGQSHAARHLRGALKPPDFLMGIRGVGLLGFEVKAKTVYRGQIFFDVEGGRRLANFGQFRSIFQRLDLFFPPATLWRWRLVGLGNRPCLAVRCPRRPTRSFRGARARIAAGELPRAVRRGTERGVAALIIPKVK